MISTRSHLDVVDLAVPLGLRVYLQRQLPGGHQHQRYGPLPPPQLPLVHDVNQPDIKQTVKQASVDLKI